MIYICLGKDIKLWVNDLLRSLIDEGLEFEIKEFVKA